MNRTIKSILLYHKDKKSPSLQSYFSIGEKGQTPFIPGGTPLRGAHQMQGAGDQPPIGRINRRISQKLNMPLIGMVTLHLHADHADIRGLVTRSIAGTQHVAQIADPYESIGSATFQNASVWITKD